MTRATKLAIPLVAAVAASLACSAPRGPLRAPFSALWIAADSRRVERAELDRLAAAGVGELFVDAARLDDSGGAPRLVARPSDPLARASKATLVVSGRWRRGGESPSRTAEAWAGVIDELASHGAEWNASVVGVHLDLDPGEDEDDIGALGPVARYLRRELRGRLFVSLAIDPDRMSSEAAAKLARAVDLAVVDVFGGDPALPDDPSQWDRAWTRERLAAARRLGTPFVAVAWTRGSAERRGRDGERTLLGATTGLADLLRSHAWAPRAGALLESVDRQVRELVAEEPMMLGKQAIRRGDLLRFTGPSTHDLEEIRDLVHAEGGELCLGMALRSVPTDTDGVSLGPANVAAAFEPGAARPDLQVEVEQIGGDARRIVVRLRLRNLSAEATELASGELNYVQLGLPSGSLVSVEPGDFAAWEQLWHGHERRTLRALRQADTLRLSAPFVGAGEQLESGRIVLRRRGEGRPALRTTAHFLLPGGGQLSLPESAAVWSRTAE